jgi:hypothetical protein
MNEENILPEKSKEEKVNENILQGGQEGSQQPDESTSSTVNKTSEIKNMEVHHHPHGHHSKKWKEYLYEFLMLFLAVTAGFFVENQREYYVEGKKEKEFIKSFTEDLKTDTLSLSVWIKNIQEYKTKIDSLMYLLSQPDLNSYGNNIYYYARFATRQSFFKSNDRTITQLKNSGGLRLIRNQEVSNSIMSYQQDLEDIEANREIAEKETAFLYPYLSRIFDPAVFETMTDNSGEISRPSNNPSLRNTNQDQIKEFLFYLHQKKTSYIFTVALLKNLRNKAEDILTFLKKEYDLQGPQKRN